MLYFIKQYFYQYKYSCCHWVKSQLSLNEELKFVVFEDALYKRNKLFLVVGLVFLHTHLAFVGNIKDFSKSVYEIRRLYNNLLA